MRKWQLPLFLSVWIAFSAHAAELPQAAVTPKPDAVFAERIKEYAKSHQAFKDCCLEEHEADFVRLAKEGQSPKTLFIGCSDSRVMPNLITGIDVGGMFIIREAGNFVPPYDPSGSYDGVAATLEYGVEVLGVTDIIICGHTHCGAIEGLFKDPASLPPLVAKWIRFGQDAKKLAESIAIEEEIKDKYTLAGKISVLFQIDNLTTYPFIKKKLDEKKLYVHGWYLDIAAGEIWHYDPDTFSFRPLTDTLKSSK
jgi:carbonic anhydrase